MMKPMYYESEIKDALQKIAATNGVQRAKILEKMARVETAHFTSLQWKLTKSFGMEAGKWPGLPKDMKTITMNDNHPEKVATLQRHFIVWDSVLLFCLYLSDYIDRHDGIYARWNSTDLNKQAAYMTIVERVKNRFI